MDNYIEQYDASKACGTLAAPNFHEQLAFEKERLTKRLQEVQEGLELMDKHPEIVRLMNIIRGGY